MNTKPITLEDMVDAFYNGTQYMEADGTWQSRMILVGSDLGLKTFATLSNGIKYDTENNYRLYQEKLGNAQRAKKKDRVRAIHAKIKNRRNDELHKLSNHLVKTYQAIFVGNVSSAKLAKTWLAKIVLDKGWSQFRNMLEYKCEHAGMFYQQINEKFTTQICSHCGSKSNSPKGRADLGIRIWKCSCGQEHDRDVNSAKNIFAVGHGRLAGGISCYNQEWMSSCSHTK